MKAAGKRRKGNAGERELVRILTEAGIPAIRMPLSGAQRGFKSDVKVCLSRNLWPTLKEMADHLEVCGNPKKIESKRRSQGFKRIEGWLVDNHAVAFRADRGAWMLCLRLDDYLKDRK